MTDQAALPSIMDIQETRTSRVLTFKLSNDEIADRVHQAVKLRRQLGDIETEFEEAKKVFKGRIAEKAAELQKIYTIESTREEERLVPCLERRDFALGLVQYVYEGKVMEERTMTVGERQTEMKPVLAAPEKQGDDAPDGEPGDAGLGENTAGADLDVPDDERENTDAPKAEDIGDVIREETRRGSKRSSVDGPTE